MAQVKSQVLQLAGKPTAPGVWPGDNTPESRAGREDESGCACATCPAHQLNLCVISKIRSVESEGNIAAHSAQSLHRARARRTIWHPKEWSDDVIVICQGWAVTSIIIEDGRRQILSLLLPGDLVSTASIFATLSNRSVETVTDVVYRRFKRGDVKAALFADPAALENMSKLWMEEREQCDQLAVSLGRRTAEERIARFILGLVERLRKLSLAEKLGRDDAATSEETFYMPLRRKHIADFTGLTPVHVSRVMIELQRSGYIKVDDRSLTITDMAGLREIAQWR